MIERSARYSIDLLDHDPAEDGSRPAEWSGALARTHLDGPNTGLTAREIGRAIRIMLDHGWDDPSIYVRREEPS